MFQSVIEAIFHHAEHTPQALCVADAQNAYTYSQMKNAAIVAALQMEALGVGAGDCVVVECSQNAAYCVCQQAIALLGAVFVPFDKKFSAERLEEMIEETNAKCLAGTNEKRSSLPFLPLQKIVPVDEAPAWDRPLPTADQRSELLYSTGTTGKSKGIDLTHGNNVAIAQNVADGVEMPQGNVELIPVAMSHSHGLRTLYANLVRGNAVVIAGGVTFLGPLFKLMDRYNVNAMDLVPSAWRVIRDMGGEKLKEYQDKIGYVELGSAPLTEEDKISLRQLLPKSRLYNFYGSTESGRTCTYNFAKHVGLSACIGKPVCNATVLVVDRDRKVMEHSSREQTGFLAFSGPMNMTGYWKNQELTDSIMENGIIYTKDVGYVDEEGWVYMLGREDDVINYGGVKISPEEIEDAAGMCPGVADCCCVGKPDPVSGQAPWLYVQAAEGVELTAAEVGAFLLKNIDRDKLPKQVVVIDQIPRTFNGKLLRRELRDRQD